MLKQLDGPFPQAQIKAHSLIHGQRISSAPAHGWALPLQRSHSHRGQPIHQLMAATSPCLHVDQSTHNQPHMHTWTKALQFPRQSKFNAKLNSRPRSLHAQLGPALCTWTVGPARSSIHARGSAHSNFTHNGPTLTPTPAPSHGPGTWTEPLNSSHQFTQRARSYTSTFKWPRAPHVDSNEGI
uniref:Uncharacterized protein n=1 Tax=Manihot esculenta TaxID=3983 RepID=A0A2C9U947_MANES